MIVKLYEENTNPRDVDYVVNLLQQGGIHHLPPTRSMLLPAACSTRERGYRQMKGYSLKQAKYSMLCADLSQLSEYTRAMGKPVYQLLRSCLPGPYTFIMEANNNVPRHYQNANKTIGLRVPANAICHAIVERLGCPLIGTSVRRLDQEEEREYLTDPELMEELFGNRVDVIVDGGIGSTDPSTVVNCAGDDIVLVRQGKGETAQLL